MPIPVPPPSPPPPGATAVRHHLPAPQGYAISQEQNRHDDALYAFGEYAVFVLMWTVEDHRAGLVERCPTCFVAWGKTAQAYGQSAKNNCPDCYGSTFEGGYRARIVRPSMWDRPDTELDQDVFGPRGEVGSATAQVQSTSDFLMQPGDYAFAVDGTRWQVMGGQRSALRTGFGFPAGTVVGVNYAPVRREDPASAAYLIPPTEDELAVWLGIQGPGWPVDLSAYEDVRGPLVPGT